MREHNIKETNTVVRKKIIEIKCDLCGDSGFGHVHTLSCVGDHRTNCEVEWPSVDDGNYYTDVSTTIALAQRVSYCGNSESEEHFFFDICPICFREKLVPWMKANI